MLPGVVEKLEAPTADLATLIKCRSYGQSPTPWVFHLRAGVILIRRFGAFSHDGPCHWRETRDSRGVATERARPCSRLDQVVANGVTDQSRCRVEAELAHDGGAVRLDCLDAEIEDGGNLLVAMALGDQLNDTLLPVAQGLLDPMRLAQKGFEQKLGSSTGEEGPAIGQRLYGRSQMLPGIRLQNVATRSSL